MLRKEGVRTKEAESSFGLAKDCAMKSQAKFSIEEAKQCVVWIWEVLGCSREAKVESQGDFGTLLMDGILLCKLMNAMEPNSVKKINKLKSPFKQRENIELYLRACRDFGLQEGGLFQVNDGFEHKNLFPFHFLFPLSTSSSPPLLLPLQVNDLYEHKNLYMVVDNLFVLGLTAQAKGWQGQMLKRKNSQINSENE